jgi:hypothetical protein
MNKKLIGIFFSAVAVIGISGYLANAAPIRVRLYYAGKPMTSLARPEFSLMGPQGWVRALQHNAGGTFTMDRPAPGAYRIHVVIDEDQSNPGDFPGDYNVFQDF